MIKIDKTFKSEPAKSAATEPLKSAAAAMPFERLPAAARAQITARAQTLKDWHEFRKSENMSVLGLGSKREADKLFSMRVGVSVSNLYAWDKTSRLHGETALMDRRANNGAKPKISGKLADKLLALYLTEKRRTCAECLRELKRAANFGGENGGGEKDEGGIGEGGGYNGWLPTVRALEKWVSDVKNVPYTAVQLYRFGDDAFYDKCSPFIRRFYDDLAPNDVWVADNHTADVIVNYGGKAVRPHITAIQDVKSRKLVGWCLTLNPCSDATVYALRLAVEKYGLCGLFYTDNGREFTAKDVGGQGFRERRKNKGKSGGGKSKSGEGKSGDGGAKIQFRAADGASDVEYETIEPINGELDAEQQTILKHLGIKFKTAIPAHGWAKPVERTFRTLKEQFSRLFDSYTGGTQEERPEAMSKILKADDIAKLPTWDEFKQALDSYITGVYNKTPHKGDGMNGRSPDDAYAAELVSQRVAAASELDLLFMRWSKPLKVGKNGVTLNIAGKKLDYS